MEVHYCNPSTSEAEAGGSLQEQSQPGLHSDLKANVNYTGIPCLKKIQIFFKKPNKTKLNADSYALLKKGHPPKK